MMKRWASLCLAVLLVLLLLPGCSALQAWEKLQDTEEPPKEPESGLEQEEDAPPPPAESSQPPQTQLPSGGKKPSAGEPAASPEPPPPADGGEEPADWEEPDTLPEAEDDSLTRLREDINRNEGTVGLAFLGYMSSGCDEVTLRDAIAHSDTGIQYPFLNTSWLVMYEGDELYAVVPPNEQGTVKVYPSTISESGEYVDDKSNPLFEGLPGETVVVQCNLSDLYSNVLITVSDGGGAFDVRPGLSGEDGRLYKELWVYDFSVYEKPVDEGEIEAAMQLLLETEEVQLAMQQGMSMMYTGDMELINGQTCLLFALGTDHEEYFVREFYYAVGDGVLYAFDSIYGTWSVLAMG